MIIGKWNKSVILSYIGLIFSVCGMYLCLRSRTNLSEVCMIIAGICDLFDGTVARMCKRTSEEKQFGIELDSLIDVFNFIAFPIVFCYCIGINRWYKLPILVIYAITGIARLAYFNIIVENDNKPVPYYHGLPVTYAALIFPLVYLLSFIRIRRLFNIILPIIILLTSILFITNIKVPKPKIKASIFLVLLAILISIIYLFVL